MTGRRVVPEVLVALGDSFTEGLQDELGPHGRHQGWADRVAVGLAQAAPGLRYANLAVRGRLLDQVVAEQLPVALELVAGAEPTALVSFHAGGNDLLRPGRDLAAIKARYADGVAALAEAGVRPLLFTVLERAGGTGRTADALARRFAAFNEVVRATAAEHDAVLVDLAAAVALSDRRLWHADRLHLNAEGHARVAAAVLEAVGLEDEAVLGGPTGWWSVQLPAAPPAPWTTRAATDAAWVARHLVPWVVRRLRGVSSGDGVEAKHPALVVPAWDDQGC